MEHITDSRVKTLLSGNVSEDTICQVLTATAAHLAVNILDESIDPAALKHRIDTYNRARHAWNREADLDSTLQHITEYWS